MVEYSNNQSVQIIKVYNKGLTVVPISLYIDHQLHMNCVNGVSTSSALLTSSINFMSI